MHRILGLCLGYVAFLFNPCLIAEEARLHIYNFLSKDVRVVICSANGTEKKDLVACNEKGREDTWTLQVSPGQKVISTFDKQGRLLSTFQVEISKAESHLSSILIYNGTTWKPAFDNSEHKGAPPKSFCNGFNDKDDCRP